MSVGELGQKLDGIAGMLPLAILVHAADTLERAARLLAECAAGSNCDELTAAVGQLVANQQQVVEIWRTVRQARLSIARYREHVGADGARPDASASVTSSRPVMPDEWGVLALTRLPKWRVGQVTGSYVADDGMGDTIVSGADGNGLHERIYRFLVDRQLLPPWMTQQESTKHVELKVGFMVRASRSANVRLAVNKPVCQDPWGCVKLLPYVLRPGQKLTITDPNRYLSVRRSRARVSYSAEISLQAEFDHGQIVVKSTSELDAAVDRMFAAGQLYHPPTIFIRERPRIGPAEVPDHGLKLAFDSSSGYGALVYLGSNGVWVTKSSNAPANGPTLYRDFDNATSFPPDALTPLDLWRVALRELLTAGGARPACVRWQPVDSW